MATAPHAFTLLAAGLALLFAAWHGSRRTGTTPNAHEPRVR